MTRFIGIFLFCVLGCVNFSYADVAIKGGRPLIGVQRWDMYSGRGATQRQELGYLPGEHGFLKPAKWHDHAPFFCRLTKDVDWVKHPANAGPVWFNYPFSQELLQKTMDQEIRYAYNTGIDFFIYHGSVRKLTEAVIKSKLGNKCKVRYDKKTIELETSKDERYILNSNLEKY